MYLENKRERISYVNRKRSLNISPENPKPNPNLSQLTTYVDLNESSNSMSSRDPLVNF